MNALRPLQASDHDPEVDFHALTPLLERFARETAVVPGNDLVGRIVARVEVARPPVRPWSFLGSLARLRGSETLKDLRDTASSAFDRSVSTVFRAQAIAMLLLAVLTVGTLGAVGAATIRPLVDGIVRPARHSDEGRAAPRSVEQDPSLSGDRVTPMEVPVSPRRAIAPARGPAIGDPDAMPGLRRAAGRSEADEDAKPGRRRAIGQTDRDEDTKPGRRRAIGQKDKGPSQGRGRGSDQAADKSNDEPRGQGHGRSSTPNAANGRGQAKDG